MNIPPEKKEEDADMQVEVEVDTSQFTGLVTQQKLDTDLDKLVEQNVGNKHDDSSSDASMEDRHNAIREHVELRERSQRVELRGRIHRVEPQRTPRTESQRTFRTESRRDDRMQDDDRPQKYNRPDQHSKGSYARRSNEQPGQIGDKRKFMKIEEPKSPESIRKSARNVIKLCPQVLEWQAVSAYQKLFQYYRGKRHLHAENVLDHFCISPIY